MLCNCAVHVSLYLFCVLLKSCFTNSVIYFLLYIGFLIDRCSLKVIKCKLKEVNGGYIFVLYYITEIPLNFDGRKEYRCGICGKLLMTSRGRREHVANHSKERIHKCDLCDKSYVTLGNLTAHKTIVHCPKEHKCQLCDGEFKYLRLLDRHLRCKHGPTLFKCTHENCERTFSTKGKMRIHEFIHTGLKPFTCENCGKSFNMKNNLKKHSYIHSDARNFICDICGASFKQPFILTRHRHLHFGEPR